MLVGATYLSRDSTWLLMALTMVFICTYIRYTHLAWSHPPCHVHSDNPSMRESSMFLNHLNHSTPSSPFFQPLKPLPALQPPPFQPRRKQFIILLLITTSREALHCVPPCFDIKLVSVRSVAKARHAESFPYFGRFLEGGSGPSWSS